MVYVTRTEDDDDDDDDGTMWWRKITKHLNFFRVHVMYYIFTPLIFSAIFYASNGRYHIPYIDALFNCVSAMTVCGLTTVNLSMLTGWQQTILFILMCLGNPVLVSWVVVLQRRHYFAIKFSHVLKANAEKHAEEIARTGQRNSWSHRVSTLLSKRSLDVTHIEKKEKKKGIIRKLRPDMIRRMDDAPKLVNPSGYAVPLEKAPTLQNVKSGHLSFVPSTVGHDHDHTQRNTIDFEEDDKRQSHRLSDLRARSSPQAEKNFPPSDTVQQQPISQSLDPPQTFPRTQTIEFAPNVSRRRARMTADMIESDIADNETPNPVLEQTLPDYRSTHSRRVSRQLSMNTLSSRTTRVPKSYKHRDFGGFPMPWEVFGRLIDRLFPKLKRRLTRTVTIPATMSLVSQHNEVPPGGKAVPYISFNATVGRNSAFQHLSHEEMEELGGVEYRALNALLWIIGVYHISAQLICFIIFAPYISQPRWHENFVPPAEIRPQSTVWFSMFQSVSAYTNTGMSLVDHSMVPFQTAYPMVIFMSYLILAGNTAFPVFLRFMIWGLTKCVSKSSLAHETLHFLLDHPRRCFIFLFPSHQTWFLFTVVFGLTMTDWFFFMVLDIGNPTTEAIPLGTRFLVGLFQAIAVRAAGFSAVSVAQLAAAVKVLYVVMMYISAYPIAMSVRSTNVYEEQSLGIFPDDDETDEVDFEPTNHRVSTWGRYLALHARKQLAFDMWWLGLALFLVCINERHNLDDPTNAEWFNIFSVVFDIVSAYGTVGLSLGTPNDNFSFAGELKSFSKFILCLVMIRGRHRILPVAIDRAVMLPSELQRQLDQNPYSDKISTSSANRAPQDDNLETRSTRRQSVSQSTPGDVPPDHVDQLPQP